MKRQILTLPELAEKVVELSDRMGKYPTHALEHAGIHKQYLSKWKKDYGRKPYYNEVAKLAEFFDKPIDVFVYSDRDPQVHIDKEKFDQLLESIQQITDTQKTDIFEYKKRIA